MATLSELQARRAQLVEQIARVTAELESNRRALSRAESTLDSTSNPAQRARLEAQIENLANAVATSSGQLAGLNQQLAEVDNQIAQLKGNPPRVNESAGEQVKQAQAARDDAATTQTPEPPAPAPVKPTNAEIINAGDPEAQVFADVQLRDTAAGQAVAAGATAQGPGAVTNVTVNASRQQNQANDDRTTDQAVALGVGSSAQVRVPVEFTKRIIPKGNPLAQFASYTYNISLYILSKQDFVTLTLSSKKDIPGGLLLMRSGGAPSSTAAAPSAGSLNIAGNKDIASRNQYFPLDFYIDDVVLRSAITGKTTGSVHNVNTLDFTISEPNGISFLDRLKAAAVQYGDKSNSVNNNINYAAQHYLMVIRFYGYDANGNLISGQNFDRPEATTDPSALVEKFIPFRLSECKFRIKNKLTEYHCKGTAVPTNIAFSAVRASIPYNVELSADTIKNLFVGPATYNTSQGTATGVTPSGATPSQQAAGQEIVNADDPEAQVFAGPEYSNTAAGQQATGAVNTPLAPAKANAAPKKTITSGLISALNDYQQTERVKEGYKPDIYEVVFEAGSGIDEAKLRKPGSLNKKDVPMQNPNGTAADIALQSNQRVTKDSKNYSVVAGTQLVQFMDIALRSSSYITDQQLWIYDEKTNKIIPQSNPNTTTQWYKIMCQCVPLEYDPKRNDYSYKITYFVKRYQINDLKSEYFKRAEFRGTHKRYDYWFTGQNSEVLDYEANFDNLYFIAMSGSPPGWSVDETNARELEFRYFQTRSDETGQGGEGKSTEPASNAASILYSPGDQGTVKMGILGDPDWLIQSDLFYGIKAANNNSFMVDGSVNIDASEILFEVNFNTPSDYNDLGTGLMDVTQNNGKAPGSAQVGESSNNSFVYRANLVVSKFQKGKFTQELEGTLMRFPTKQMVAQSNSPVKQTAATAPVPSGTMPMPAMVNDGQGSELAFGDDLGIGNTVSTPVKPPDPVDTTIYPDPESYQFETQAQPAPVPVTSNTQNISVPPVNNGAARTASVTVRLISGSTVTVTDPGEISDLYVNDRISQAEYERSLAILELNQARASVPVTSAPNQPMVREA